MPTALILLAFSWLIAIPGILVAGYLIIFRFNEPKLLITSYLILLGSILLAMLIRMFGNIGQVLFDLKDLFLYLNQELKTQTTTVTQTLIQGFAGFSQDVKEAKETLSKNLFMLNQDLKIQLQQLQAQTDDLSSALKYELTILTQDLKAQLQLQTDDLSSALNHEFSGLNQDLRAQLQSQTDALSKALNHEFSGLNQDLRVQLQSQTDALSKALNHELKTQTTTVTQTLIQGFAGFSQDAKEAKETLSKDLFMLNQDLKTQLQAQTDGLSSALNHELKTQLKALISSLEQINCDAKDINQNIHQIKTFFEQIERHLDLKK